MKLIENNKKVIVLLFFLGFLFIGLNIFNDYGVHWDEYHNQQFGERWYGYIRDFISKGFLPAPINNKYGPDLIHGPAFELFLVFVEKELLNLTDSRDVILMRHLFTFLLFYLSVFFFYLLYKFHFKSWKIGLLGSLFLILHPRIFSHSFYNSVDISFLSFYIISAYTLIRYLEKKTFPRAVFHALTCAILIGIGVVGVILLLCTFVFSATDLLRLRGDKEEIKKIIKTILVFAVLVIAFTFVFRPFLWENPIGNFFRALAATSKFHRPDVPPPLWYYNLKWIIVTTPLLYSFCFLVGFFVCIKVLFKYPIKLYPQNRTVLIVIFLLFVPIILPIIYKTTLFDGWRHHYFIYPIFLVFSFKGLIVLSEFIKIKFYGLGYKIINTAFIFIILSSLTNTVQFMVKYHPHQCIYANILAGRDMRRAKERFALDYWGLSYKKGLEYVLKNDKSKTIKVCVDNRAGVNNINIFPPDDRKRLVYVKDLDKAEYFLGNYKSSGWYKWHKGEYPDKKEYYSMKFGEVKFMVVYKLKE
ncbi:MAG: hypothetical protein ACETWM_14585 [Candidatus Lokiarchaeia archaeon]